MNRCPCNILEEHPANECITPWESDVLVQQRDLAAIVEALGLPDHARPYSPHAVVHRDILPAIHSLTIREDVNAAIAGDLIAFQMNAWDEGMTAHTEGRGSDSNPYRAALNCTGGK